jgi:hypothetical protein
MPAAVLITVIMHVLQALHGADAAALFFEVLQVLHGVVDAAALLSV